MGKKQKGDEDDVIDNDDELIEELDDVDMDKIIEIAQKGLHDQTTLALNVIKGTGWLEQSMSNKETGNPISVHENLLRPDKNLIENEIKKQNENKVNCNDDEN